MLYLLSLTFDEFPSVSADVFVEQLLPDSHRLCSMLLSLVSLIIQDHRWLHLFWLVSLFAVDIEADKVSLSLLLVSSVGLH